MRGGGTAAGRAKDNFHDNVRYQFWHWCLMTLGIDFASIWNPFSIQIYVLGQRFFFMSWGIDFLLIIIKNGSHFVPGDVLFLVIFLHLDRSCSPGCVLGHPLAHCDTWLASFWRLCYLDGSILASDFFLFGTRICKASVEQPQGFLNFGVGGMRRSL